jgi:2-succinyl-5-enolpyruvyl-6-hydroxy-3-cyclohexene-1-carboxylate synthase
MSRQAEDNLHWCFRLLDGLAMAGVRRLVLSPGSRSTPLVLAAEGHPQLRLHTLIDERSAGFFALGLSRFDATPAVLIATSGSAPAHWYPAVIEANQGQVPLILVSADRPPELHDWGANQSIDQTRLFGTQVRAFHDPGPARSDEDGLRFIHQLGRKAVRQSRWPRPGPVHINLPLREPLVPATRVALPACAPPEPFPGLPRSVLDPADLESLRATLSGGRGLIVCGPLGPDPELAPALAALSERLACPLLADPLSGLRCQGEMRSLARYDAFLRHPRAAEALAPDWVLRIGAAPVSKTLLGFLEQQPQARQLLLAPGGDWPDPLQRSQVINTDPARCCAAVARLQLDPAPGDWLSRWQALERLAEDACAPLVPNQAISEDAVIAELLHRLPANALLFSGNSLPIRQLDSWCAGRPEPLRILANRGASGIDGNVSTLLGLAAAGAEPAVGLLGDLALLHDSNGLLAAPGLKAAIVVLNNGGGGIFGYLPQAGLRGFERHWLTPQGLDLAQLAALHRLGHTRVHRQDQFGPALSAALAAPGVSLIEVMLERVDSQARHEEYWRRVSASPLP